MLDSDEELILEGYNVSWLIWVQLLVTILLLFVLFCGFTMFSGDQSYHPSCSSASTSSFSTNHSYGKNSLLNGCTSFQVDGIHCVQREMDASTSKGMVGEQSLERELPARDAALLRPFGHADHPCSVFGFAKQAILKCLGLDAVFESSLKRRHRKDD